MLYLHEGEGKRAVRNQIELDAFYWLAGSLVVMVVGLLWGAKDKLILDFAFYCALMLGVFSLVLAISTGRWRPIFWIFHILVGEIVVGLIVGFLVACGAHQLCL